MTDAAPALAYVRDNRQRFAEELKAFVRFPSVSAQVRHKDDVARCAQWLAGHLRQIGLECVRIGPTKGHPVVCAEAKRSLSRPTVLLYGHYDVQPAEPLREWQTPPFSPAIRDGNLFGRGASDDKGQMFAHVKALEAYIRTARTPPANVKCVFEGEEEIGSPNLASFLLNNPDRCAADVAVVSDTPMLAVGRPAVHHAVRGALYTELEVRGPGHDLHSGNFGGAIHNPLQVLCGLIGTLHDPSGRVAISGFYDRVRDLSERDRARMAEVGPSDRQMLNDAECRGGWGEPGYSLYERIAVRPALTVNGVSGGYQGQGAKGIIPARASAKISFRLVPDQDPREIAQLLRAHIARLMPSTVRSSLRTLSMAEPAVLGPNHPALRAAAEAYRESFGAAPVLLRSGGTIPIVSTLQAQLRIPTVLMGFALPDDHMHAPNEKFSLDNFFNGIATSIRFLARIGAAGRTAPARVAQTVRPQRVSFSQRAFG
jgi:acetylornithine deacetylase/succinyl-diaminopimelate desuccinylase-like protein